MSIYSLFPYLLRRSSSHSKWNIARRVVSIWHGRWQYLSRRSSLHQINSKSSFSVSCHVLIGLPAVLPPPPGIHSTARLAGPVAGSSRMCPTNRLLLVATLSCSANCPDRAISSSSVMCIFWWSRIPENDLVSTKESGSSPKTVGDQHLSRIILSTCHVW